jgi:hypothetical protein
VGREIGFTLSHYGKDGSVVQIKSIDLAIMGKALERKRETYNTEANQVSTYKGNDHEIA